MVINGIINVNKWDYKWLQMDINGYKWDSKWL